MVYHQNLSHRAPTGVRCTDPRNLNAHLISVYLAANYWRSRSHMVGTPSNPKGHGLHLGFEKGSPFSRSTSLQAIALYTFPLS